ncbi:MAG: ABC transporter substrate-binding protein [Gemmataceae bacterium]|nr:ABC transporter substrate-binding protein [Gemmataceae bacterium]
MTRRTSILFVLIGLALTAGCEKRPSDAIVFGHPVALTGAGREEGLACLRGVQLAVEEVNADSALHIAGKKVAVIHADTASKPENVGHQAVRLVVVNRAVGLLGGLTGADSRSLAEAAQLYGVPLIGASGYAGAKSAFSLGANPAERVRAIETVLGSKADVSGILILVDSRSARLSQAAENLAAAWQKRGRKAEIVPVPEAGPVPAIPAGSTAVFLCSAAELTRFTIPAERVIFAGDESEADRLPAGAKYVAAYGPETTPARDAFAAKYRERFSAEPPTAALQMYDAARTLFAAGRDARGFTLPRFREVMRTESFDRLLGKVTFNEENLARRPVFILERTAARPNVVGRIEPTGP